MDVVLQYSRRQKHLMQRRTQPQKKYGWLPKLLLFKLLLFMDCTLCPWAFREVVCPSCHRSGVPVALVLAWCRGDEPHPPIVEDSVALTRYWTQRTTALAGLSITQKGTSFPKSPRFNPKDDVSWLLRWATVSRGLQGVGVGCDRHRYTPCR